MKKPTDTNIGEFFGLSRQTIATYRQVKQRTYQALLEYFIKNS
jgi:hypothetical protein